MQRPNILKFLWTLGLLIPSAAMAQPSVPLTSLDQRVTLCLQNETCALPEKLQLMGEVTNELQSALLNIQTGCLRTKYENCASPRLADMIRWHRMDDALHVLMKSVEAEQTAGTLDRFPRPPAKSLNKIEPAAGTPNRYTDPDQEQQERMKENWWRNNWSPLDDANPYRQW